MVPTHHCLNAKCFSIGSTSSHLAHQLSTVNTCQQQLGMAHKLAAYTVAENGHGQLKSSICFREIYVFPWKVGGIL